MKLTANAAAAQTRAVIKRHITRLRKWRKATNDELLDDLLAFINSMAKRAGKKKGGLGRK